MRFLSIILFLSIQLTAHAADSERLKLERNVAGLFSKKEKQGPCVPLKILRNKTANTKAARDLRIKVCE